MLFTDGLIVSSADLAKLDSEIPDVASSCQPAITLTDITNDAQQEVGSYLLGIGGRFHGRWTNVYNGPSFGMQSLYTESANRPRYSLSQIVVTDAQYPAMWSELKRYLVYVALYNFYRDASRRPGNSRDRYSEKRDVYEKEIGNKYLPRLIKAGLPIVSTPLACPGAFFEAVAGTWSASNLSLVSGGTGGSTASYDVAISWLDLTAAQNNESAPSILATLSVPAGQRILISIANLTAPNGQYNTASFARIPIIPLKASHWNVYAAVTGQPLTLQNGTPIPYATKSYTLAIPTISTGAFAGTGQYADIALTIQPNTLMRS